MDRHIAKYIGISDPNFIAIIRHLIDLYKWIQQKNSYKKLLTVEEKILLKKKVEDVKTLNVRDSMKVDHFLLNKNKNIDNFDGSSAKKKMDNRIRVVEMTLNENEIEVLLEENLEEVENKTVLLYAECSHLDYRVEDTKEIISFFNKKEKFFKDKTDKSIEPILEEIPVTKTNLNVKKQGQNAQNTLNQNKVLDEILRRLQNIEERQRTYGESIDKSKPAGLLLHIASLVNNVKTKNASQLTSSQVDNNHFLK
ncbi:45695_t:CDS:2, partial [Gigaspora margarita]